MKNIPGEIIIVPVARGCMMWVGAVVATGEENSNRTGKGEDCGNVSVSGRLLVLGAMPVEAVLGAAANASISNFWGPRGLDDGGSRAGAGVKVLGGYPVIS